MPTIEPIQNTYLSSFGRSYQEAQKHEESSGSGSKEHDQQKSDGENSGEDPSDDDDDNDDGGGDGGDGDGDGDDDNHSFSGAEDWPGTADKNMSAVSTVTPRGKRKKNGVFLANLPYGLCAEDKLHAIFSGFGRITDVVMSKPPLGKM